MAGIADVNRYPVIHTWSYRLTEVACYVHGARRDYKGFLQPTSVRSVWYRVTGRLCCCRVVGVHMANPSVALFSFVVSMGAACCSWLDAT